MEGETVFSTSHFTYKLATNAINARVVTILITYFSKRILVFPREYHQREIIHLDLQLIAGS